MFGYELYFYLRAKLRKSMDDKIIVGGRGGLDVNMSPWKISLIEGGLDVNLSPWDIL